MAVHSDLEDARPPVPVDIAFDQRFDLHGLAALRLGVSAHGDALGLAEDQLEDLLIISSELATNAVRHGGGSGRLQLWRDGNVVFCRVSDNGPNIIDPAAGKTLPDPTMIGGRGLWLCRRLSDRLYIESSVQGSTVTAAIVLDDGDCLTPARSPAGPSE